MNMPSRLSRQKLVSGIAFVLIVGVVVAVAAESLMKPRQPPLRIAFNAWPGYDFLTVAQELGYFQEEGVEVKLVKLASLGDARRIYERGQADMLASSMAEAIYIVNDGKCDIRSIAIADYSCGADVLVASKDIRSVSELKGRRVAVEPHSLDVVNLAFALSSVGLALTDIELVMLHQAEIPRAFNEGRIDAAQTYPPVSVLLKRDPNRHVVFDTSAIPGKVLDCLSASPQTIRERRSDLVKVLRAYFRVQQLYLDHPNRVTPLLAKHLQIEPDELRDTMRGIGLIPLDRQAAEMQPNGKLVESLREATKQLEAAGLSNRTQDWSRLVDASLVSEVSAP